MSLALLFSVLLAVIAPLAARQIEKYDTVHAAIDAFVLMVILGLVFLWLLPEALASAGLWGAVVAVAAFVTPWIGEQLWRRYQAESHRLLLLIAAGAIAVHAISDGVLLSVWRDQPHAGWLEFGMVVHRFVVSITIWWLLQTVLSPRGTYMMLVLMAALTIGGYLLTGIVADISAPVTMGVWQALAAGSLMHVIMHPTDTQQHSHSAPISAPIATSITLPRPTYDKPGAMARLGSLLGLVFIGLLLINHGAEHHAPEEHLDFSHDNMGVAQHNHAAFDTELLMQVGHVIAPLLLGIAVLWPMAAYLRQRGGAGLAVYYQGLVSQAPWALFAWILLTAAAYISGVEPQVYALDFLPAPGWWLMIWLGLSIILLLERGARLFFAAVLGVLPHRHAHQHDSSAPIHIHHHLQ